MWISLFYYFDAHFIIVTNLVAWLDAYWIQWSVSSFTRLLYFHTSTSTAEFTNNFIRSEVHWDFIGLHKASRRQHDRQDHDRPGLRISEIQNKLSLKCTQIWTLMIKGKMARPDPVRSPALFFLNSIKIAKGKKRLSYDWCRFEPVRRQFRMKLSVWMAKPEHYVTLNCIARRPVSLY